jgi:hypothetical protein
MARNIIEELRQEQRLQESKNIQPPPPIKIEPEEKEQILNQNKKFLALLNTPFLKRAIYHVSFEQHMITSQLIQFSKIDQVRLWTQDERIFYNEKGYMLGTIFVSHKSIEPTKQYPLPDRFIDKSQELHVFSGLLGNGNLFFGSAGGIVELKQNVWEHNLDIISQPLLDAFSNPITTTTSLSYRNIPVTTIPRGTPGSGIILSRPYWETTGIDSSRLDQMLSTMEHLVHNALT